MEPALRLITLPLGDYRVTFAQEDFREDQVDRLECLVHLKDPTGKIVDEVRVTNILELYSFLYRVKLTVEDT